ncbi:hypothetical protein ACH5RR_007467 [Cinchona calisaya]|uniref:Uncharacterized protein n=1 Tax=Cinchona calisaya TaxID=153742 RepID=A0ABD3AS89_9GENT
MIDSDQSEISQNGCQASGNQPDQLAQTPSDPAAELLELQFQMQMAQQLAQLMTSFSRDICQVFSDIYFFEQSISIEAEKVFLSPAPVFCEKNFPQPDRNSVTL